MRLLNRVRRDFTKISQRYPRQTYASIGAILVLLGFAFFSGGKKDVIVFNHPNSESFKKGRILTDSRSAIFEGKEKALNRTARQLLDSHQKLKEDFIALQEEMRRRSENGKNTSEVEGLPVPDEVSDKDRNPTSSAGAHPSDLNGTELVQGSSDQQAKESRPPTRPRVKLGPSVITFPVGSGSKDLPTIPKGSYVKAVLKTGLANPEGKAYPALLVLDYSFVTANNYRVDLSGCFVIAKTQANPQTDRIEGQATDLICVSKSGEAFERKISGFMADTDSTFAIKAELDSKQDRVASQAFLSSIVSGVTSAIQSQQFTTQGSAQTGFSSVFTGDRTKHIVAGGAGAAAQRVSDWYLKKAERLLPVLKVESGRPVFLVLQKSIKLPKRFFKKEKGKGNETVFNYLSRLVD